MAKISINLKWSLNGGELSPGKYSNKHQIEFNDKIIINGDAAPDWNGSKQNSNRTSPCCCSKQLSYDDFFSSCCQNELAGIDIQITQLLF